MMTSTRPRSSTRFTVALAGLATFLGTSVAAAATPQPNTNCQNNRYSVVVAQPVTTSPLAYQGSISALLASTASDPDPNVHAFTQAYYDSIEGAAGYYYVLQRDFRNSDDKRYWAAIPIIDEQPDVTTPVSFYATLPAFSNIRFPTYADNAVTDLYAAAQGSSRWPESGGIPLGHWVSEVFLPQTGSMYVYPFVLRTADYTALQSVMGSSAADSTVDPQDLDCVLIVDPNGDPLDFAAHITEWDPKPSCPACGN